MAYEWLTVTVTMMTTGFPRHGMIMGCAINKQQEDQCQQWGFEA
jgi:hypothetical protein